MRAPCAAVFVTLSVAFSGCSSTALATWQTMAQAWRGGASLDAPPPLNPSLQYLRVQIRQQVGWMVRADDAGDSNAPPEAGLSRWYSADGVVLRLEQGRVTALHDGRQSWTRVALPTPIDWHQLAAGTVLRFREVSDQMPGYRMGVARERLLMASAHAPPAEVLDAARHVTAPVTWFEERAAAPAASPSLAASAWFAVDLSSRPAPVVFGHACLQADWCVNWQPWPPLPPRPQ